MTKNLRYTGSSDARELSPEDLLKLGVEADEPLRFEKGSSTVVDDAVADLLMNQVRDIRETTDDEVDQEVAQLEAELGFSLYDPGEYNVDDVVAELANSPENRRQYILNQERAGKRRKGIFEAVGAELGEEAAEGEAPLGEGVKEEMAAAGGQIQATTGEGGTPPPTGRASTA